MAKYEKFILKLTDKARQQKLDEVEAGILKSVGQVAELQAENAKLQTKVDDVREALLILNRLRMLYNISANMLVEPTQSAAKPMIKQAEEGLQLAEKRKQQEYIEKLQAKNELLKKVILLAPGSNEKDFLEKYKNWWDTYYREIRTPGCNLLTIN